MKTDNTPYSGAHSPTRRNLLIATPAALALAGLGGCRSFNTGKSIEGRVAIIGGGCGGATAARYLRLWSQGSVQVTLVERQPQFISAPLSNLVIGGSKTLTDLTLNYDNLRERWGVQVIHEEVSAIDSAQKSLRLATGGKVDFDHLVLSPGIDFDYRELPTLHNNSAAQSIAPHAWKAGEQTRLLRQQLEAMADGGVFVMTIPKAPFCCPAAAYERACQVANYFKTNKPRAKILILDANADVVTMKALFIKTWTDLYPGMIEYRPSSTLRDVASRSAILDSGAVKADVLNVIPPQRAGSIALTAGLKLIDQRWVSVDWRSMEAIGSPGIHVIGDAVSVPPTMQKSGHLANQHAKLAAAAILDQLNGKISTATPVINDVIYSFVDSRTAIHSANVHQYDLATRTMQAVKGAGGFSPTRNQDEGLLAMTWARGLWADMLA